MQNTITRKRRCWMISCVLLVAVFLVTARAFAQQPGSLDLTFSGDGKVIDGVVHGSDTAQGIGIQQDGKMVVGGRSQRGSGFVLAVVRYNIDGSLDTSFDGDGKAITSIQSVAAAAIAIQPDGKIVAGGAGQDNFRLARFNPDGSLDTSFGISGIVPEHPGGAYSICLQTDGKIVVAGVFNVYRFNSDGSPDASFGGGSGVVALPIFARSATIQPDGKIIAAGLESSLKGHLAVARFNTDGSPDLTFDSDGMVVTAIGYLDAALSVAIQMDGKIVAAGRSIESPTSFFTFAVVRYLTDGSLDTSFDSDGIVLTPIRATSTCIANSVAIQTDGKIIAAGSTSGPSSFALARYNSDGSLDSDFDSDGKVTTSIGSSASATTVAMLPDGKILAVGSGSGVNGSRDYAVVRYHLDGSLDTSFDGDGRVTTDFGRFANNLLAATTIQQDGRIIAVGNAVTRYNQNGSPDTTFAVTGKVSFQGGTTAFSADIQPDGKIVVAGACSDCSASGTNDFVVTRYNPDGTVDMSFANNGTFTISDGAGGAYSVHALADGKILAAGFNRVVRLNSDGSPDTTFGGGSGTAAVSIQVFASAIQSDGKIVAAGAYYSGSNFDFAVARVNTDGSLDTSFDLDGVVTTPIGLYDDGAKSVALQSDGKIVAAGYSSNDASTRFDFTVTRYNTDGSLDPSFDGDGRVTTPIGSTFTSAASVVVESDGKILTAGANRNDLNDDDFALARYNQNGSLDTTFGGGDGITMVEFESGANDRANGMALDNDGRATVVGETDGAFALARFHLAPGTTAANTAFDFDGDGRADVSVFRPSDRIWYLDRSTQGFSATQFGLSTDKLTPADYDGDGQTDIAVFREGTWYWLDSSDGSFKAFQFGLPSDIPVPDDYTGDGRSEIAVYRSGTWWTLDLATQQASAVQFGIATDKPVVADYDGDGRADQAVYRGNGEWHLNRSAQGYVAVSFGLATDRPVPADFDGDGKADQAVYRDGTWYVLQSSQGFTAFQFGISTDIPVPADYDGDGNTDLAVYRSGTWYLLQSTSGFSAQQFGLANDLPVPSAFLP